MPTLNKLEYLNETKAEIKTALNQFGSGITDEDTFRSYVDKIKAIYNNWQKVIGTGTNITLQNTKLAKMILELGGNTEQNGKPTSDNPVEVEVVKGENNVKVQNENLLDTSVTPLTRLANYTINDNIIDIASTSTSSHGGIAWNIPVKVGENITISYGDLYDETITDNIDSVRYYFTDNPLDSLTNTDIGTVINKTTKYITITATNRNLLVLVRVQRQNNYKLSDLMVSYLSNSTYIPHQEQNYTITLPEGMELCKIGDYQDRIYGTPDNWFWEKYSIKTINVENLFKTFGTGGDGKKYVLVSKTSLGMEVGAYNNRMLCNKFKQQTVPTNRIAGEFLTISNNDNVQFIVDDKYTSLAEVKADITDVTVVGVSTTPTTTPITDTTLIQQLNDLYYANSYQLQTNISQTNTDLPFIITSTALMKGGN